MYYACGFVIKAMIICSSQIRTRAGIPSIECRLLDKLVSWSKTLQMQFNVTKCHTMRISRKKEPVLMELLHRWPKAVSREEPSLSGSYFI